MLFPAGLSSDPADLFTIAPADPVFPFPLRDLPVCYSPEITLHANGVIFIIGAEISEEVEYYLRNEQGEVITDNNGLEIIGTPLSLVSDTDFNKFIAEFKDEAQSKLKPGWKVFCDGPADPSLGELVSALQEVDKEMNLSDDFKTTWKRVVRFSVVIDNNSTFSILARKKTHVTEALLTTKVNYRTSIDETIGVTFIEKIGAQIEAKTSPVTLDPANQYAIKISPSQDGVNYQVINITNHDSTSKIWERRSARQEGVGGDLEIEIPKNAKPEADALWAVRAFKPWRGDTVFEEKFLEDRFTITVPLRANIDFSSESENSSTKTVVSDFNAIPLLHIESPQLGVQYELFALPLHSRANYAPDGQLRVQRSALITDDDLNDDTRNSELQFIYTFTEDGAPNIAVDTTKIMEDSLLVVRAKIMDVSTKLTTAVLWLDKHLTILVKPDPGIPLSSPQDGAQDFLRLINAQSGAGYQLREANPPFTEIGPVLYTEATGIGREVTDREGHSRVFGMQINGRDVDFPGDAPQPSGNYFKIEKAEENKFLEFRTADIEKEKIYEILAIKEYTGLTEVLSHGIKITEEGAEIIPTE